MCRPCTIAYRNGFSFVARACFILLSAFLWALSKIATACRFCMLFPAEMAAWAIANLSLVAHELVLHWWGVTHDEGFSLSGSWGECKLHAALRTQLSAAMLSSTSFAGAHRRLRHALGGFAQSLSHLQIISRVGLGPVATPDPSSAVVVFGALSAEGEAAVRSYSRMRTTKNYRWLLRDLGHLLFGTRSPALTIFACDSNIGLLEDRYSRFPNVRCLSHTWSNEADTDRCMQIVGTEFSALFAVVVAIRDADDRQLFGASSTHALPPLRIVSTFGSFLVTYEKKFCQGSAFRRWVFWRRGRPRFVLVTSSRHETQLGRTLRSSVDFCLLRAAVRNIQRTASAKHFSLVHIHCDTYSASPSACTCLPAKYPCRQQPNQPTRAVSFLESLRFASVLMHPLSGYGKVPMARDCHINSDWGLRQRKQVDSFQHCLFFPLDLVELRLAECDCVSVRDILPPQKAHM